MVNPFSTHTLRLDDIAGADPGYLGLDLELRNGTTVTAWAVQKSNFASWSGRTTRADTVAQVIVARLT